MTLKNLRDLKLRHIIWILALESVTYLSDEAELGTMLPTGNCFWWVSQGFGASKWLNIFNAYEIS